MQDVFQGPAGQEAFELQGFGGDDGGARFVPSRLAKAQEGPEDPNPLGMMDYIADVGKGVVGGGLDAVEELYYMGNRAVNFLDDNIGDGTLVDDDYERFMPDVNVDTAAGELARGITKFTVGMLGAGKFMAGFKILQGASKGVTIARTLTQGALVDATMFKGNEPRLSNLIEQFPALQNPITAYLAADDDDGEAEGRMKNVLEGVLVAGVTAPFMKVLKAMRTGNKMAEAGVPEKTINSKILPILKEAQEELKACSDPSALKVLDRETADIGTILGKTDDGRFRVLFGDQERILAKDNVVVAPNSRGMSDDEALRRFGLTDENEKPLVEGLTERYTKELETVLGGAEGVRAAPPAVLRAQIKHVDVQEWTKGFKEFIEKPDEFAIKGYDPTRPINPLFVEGKEDVSAMLQSMSDAFAGDFKKTYGGRMSFDTMIQDSSQELSYMMGDPSLAVGILNRSRTEAEALHGRILAGKYMASKLAERAASISRMLLDPSQTTPKLELELIQTGNVLREVLEQTKGAITGAARATTAGRIRFATLDEQLRGTMEGIDNFISANKGTNPGLEDLSTLNKRLAMLIDEPNKLAKVLADSMGPSEKFWGVVNEYWINNVLSSVKTQAVNVTSNMIHAAVMPASRIAGGIIKRDAGLIREGGKMYVGYAKFFNDAVQMAKYAFKSGENLLDSSGNVFDTPVRRISSEFLGIEQPGLAKAVNYMGLVLNMPSRLLMSTDEFFKQLAYRSQGYAALYEKALDLGIEDPKAIAQFVENGMAAAFQPTVKNGQEVLGRGSVKEWIDTAREMTFTQDLAQGGLGKKIIGLTNAHPYLKIILPFVKTPTNLMKTVATYTPGVARLLEENRAILEAGGRNAAILQGKMALGSLFWGAGTTLALGGNLTGGGPKDKAKRAALYESGWQPYSFVFQNAEGKKEYVSFARLDPFATFLGLCGDIADIGAQVDESTFTDLTTMLGVALAKNLTSKTYLRGLSEALGAINDPDENFAAWSKRLATSLVPLSGFEGDLRRGFDDNLREVTTVVEAMKDKIPGMSSSLPARYSWVTGEAQKQYPGLGPDAVSPFATGTEHDSEVVREIAKLGHGFQAPLREIDGVELTTEQYARLKQLHGTLKINGKTMQETLQEVINSEGYDKNRKRIPDSPDEYESHRVRIIKKVIGAYRMAAKNALLNEDKGLYTAVASNRGQKQAWKSGSIGELERFTESMQS